jgi:hypothetical protein
MDIIYKILEENDVFEISIRFCAKSKIQRLNADDMIHEIIGRLEDLEE